MARDSGRHHVPRAIAGSRRLTEAQGGYATRNRAGFKLKAVKEPTAAPVYFHCERLSCNLYSNVCAERHNKALQLVVNTKYGLVMPNGAARNSDHQTEGKGFGLVSCRQCDVGASNLSAHGVVVKIRRGRK